MESYRVAAKKLGNIVILNHSTYVANCKTNWDSSTSFDYLYGKSDRILLPETNHNFKNCSYQLIGGSCATVIGNNFFDPWLLKTYGVTKEIIIFEDFAYDGAVLHISSSKTIKKLFELDSSDFGNFSVRVFHLYLRGFDHFISMLGRLPG